MKKGRPDYVLSARDANCPSGAVDAHLPVSAGDMGSIPGLGGFHVLWSNSAQEPQLPRLSAATAEAHA